MLASPVRPAAADGQKAVAIWAVTPALVPLKQQRKLPLLHAADAVGIYIALLFRKAQYKIQQADVARQHLQQRLRVSVGVLQNGVDAAVLCGHGAQLAQRVPFGYVHHQALRGAGRQVACQKSGQHLGARQHQAGKKAGQRHTKQPALAPACPPCRTGAVRPGMGRGGKRLSCHLPCSAFLCAPRAGQRLGARASCCKRKSTGTGAAPTVPMLPKNCAAVLRFW